MAEPTLDVIVLSWALTHSKFDRTELGRHVADAMEIDLVMAKRFVEDALARLIAQGHVVAPRRAEVTVTESGRARLLDALGLDSFPGRTEIDWPWISKVLLARKFEQPLTPAVLKRGDVSELMRVGLLRKKLGVLAPNEVNANRVIRDFINRELRITSRTLLHRNRAVIGALLEGASPNTNLASFAHAVDRLARAATTGRWHDNKVFISHVWNAFRENGAAGDMTYQDFQRKLVEAHQERLLRLSRADLVEAMPPEDVHSSETAYLRSTFHFVRID